MKLAVLLVTVLGALPFVARDPPKPPAPAAREVVAVKAANVKWGDHPFISGGKLCVQSGDPAKGASVLRMKFPKGTTVPAHWHTSDETVTVVSGVGIFGTGELVDASKGTALTAGGCVIIPSKSPHWAIVKEELVITVALEKPADFHPRGTHT
jgi:quercetin dioxygenase-like cupin family protein